MDGDHGFGSAEQIRAARLVEATAGDVQRFEISTRLQSLEQIEMEILTRDDAGEFRCSPLDAAAVRRHDGDARPRNRPGNDPVVQAFGLVCRQFGKACIFVPRRGRQIRALRHGGFKTPRDQNLDRPCWRCGSPRRRAARAARPDCVCRRDARRDATGGTARRCSRRGRCCRRCAGDR